MNDPVAEREITPFDPGNTPVAIRDCGNPYRLPRHRPRDTVLIDVGPSKKVVAELEALPGIGKVLARRVVEGRPYGSVDELERVPGIGPKRMAEIKPLVGTED